jgi:ATP-binding cassette subfamily B protein
VFDNVSFGYAEGPDIVRDLNLHVPHGQKIGVVGPSGAGKSTLVHLLQRLHDVRSGHILIDGRRIDDLEHESLTEVLAVVPQEVSLFHRSVMENIRFARPTASDEEVFAAARAAASDGFIRALPQGYDTVLGERGAKLSGGQRQRIGIARAFLKNAPIIILDEATSALDTETELLIQDAINRLMAGRTVIAVAHRLSTLLTFDRVLVMENGRVVEDGGVAELRARGGVFERMWRVQAEGLAEADEVEKAAA